MSSLTLPPDQLRDCCRKYGIRSLALFGSFLHGDADDASDVDLLFELEPGRRIGLLTLFEKQSELSRILGRTVGLVPRDGLKPELREAVLSEARTLLVSAEAAHGAA